MASILPPSDTGSSAHPGPEFPTQKSDLQWTPGDTAGRKASSPPNVRVRVMLWVLQRDWGVWEVGVCVCVWGKGSLPLMPK